MSLYSLLLLYQQVMTYFKFFNMSYLGVILQMRGRDSIYTLQNGAAAYSQSHVPHIF